MAGKTKRLRKSSAGIWRVIVVVVFLALVEACVAKEWISPLFVSRPSQILTALGPMVSDGRIFSISGTTLYMALVTFALGAATGLPLGYFLWRYPLLGRACEPLFGSLFASPLILLYPVFLVLFGRTLTAIIAQALLVGVIPIILGTYNALRQVNRTLIEAGLTLGVTRWQLLRHILLPASAPLIFTGLRLGFIYILLSIIAMEYVVALGGIGNLISSAYFRLDTQELYVGVFLVILFSVLFLRVLLKGQRLLGTL
ncbi:MAG TPA: ABC transporter permease [Candidatus Acidoferrales bacterium]|nr:ABC transporter permease [Candidatus Acidoferrales bacterium]